jgi:outer membrane protein OmpA-like peptidoglycan-associated protein
MRKFGALAGLLAVLMIDLYAPPPAHACGVKLAIKYSRPRRAAAASAKPSSVLLVGSPPERLKHDLSSAGHDVEVTSDASSHKRASYDIVVVASNEQAQDARQTFPDAAIVVRSGDVTADVRSIEGQAGRRPVRVASGREVIAAGPTRADPTAAGTGKGEKIAAKPASDERRVAAGTAKPDETKAVAKAEEPKNERLKVEEPTKEPTKQETTAEKVSTSSTKSDETKPARTTAAALDSEVYFAVNSSTLGDKRGLDKAVKWLKANVDAHATVEGYADPTGSRDWNMTLSQQRAEAVRDYLVTQGIDTSRLDVVGYGDTKMKYGHTDRRNRRVAVEASP